MRNKWQKFISTFVALSMVCALLPSSALAWWAGDVFAQPFANKKEVVITKDTSNPPSTFVTAAKEGNVRIVVRDGVNIDIQNVTDITESSGPQKGRMKPVLIGPGTEVVGEGNASLVFRSPMQLAGDGVSFQNIDMRFASADGNNSVPHREIFLAGYSLTLDNVSTSNPVRPGMGGIGSSESDLLPLVFAGGYKSNSSNNNYSIGSHAQLTVKNSGNGQTRFQAIYLSHEDMMDMLPLVHAPIASTYNGQATLTLDPKVQVVDGSKGSVNFPCGIFSEKTSNARIIYSSASGTSPSISPFTLQGNSNTTVILENCTLDTRSKLYDVAQVEVGSGAEFKLDSTSSIQHLILKPNGKLSPNGEALLHGNLVGGGTIYFEKNADRLEIRGDVSGRTELTQWGNTINIPRITTKIGTQPDAFFITDSSRSLVTSEKNGKLQWRLQDNSDPAPTLGSVMFKDEQGKYSLPEVTVSLSSLQGNGEIQKFKVVCSDLKNKYIDPAEHDYEFLLADVVAVKSAYWDAKDTGKYDAATDWNGDLFLTLADTRLDIFYLSTDADHKAAEDYTLLFFKDASAMPGEQATFGELRAAATSANLASGSLKVKLVADTLPPQPPIEASFTLTSGQPNYTFGDQAVFTFTTTDPDAQGKTIELYSGQQKLAEQTLTGDSAQLIYDTTDRSLQPGVNTITAVYNGKPNAASCTVTVDPKPMTEDMFAAIAPQTFSGSAHTPHVSSVQPTSLQQGDYTVSYEDNVNAGQGKAVIKAVDNGFFTGTVTKTFTIDKAAFGSKTANSSAKFGAAGTLDLTPYLCSGARTGQITVKDDRSILTGAPVVKNGKTLTYQLSSSAALGSTAEISVPVTADNYKDYTITIIVTVLDKQAQTGFGFASSTVSKTYTSEDFTLTANGAVPGSTVTYVSRDTNVAAVDKNTGKVTITGVGETVIMATASATADYAETAANYTLTVDKSTITITAGNKTAYVGDAVPSLGENDYTIVGLRGGESLKKKPSIKYASTPDMSKSGTIEIQISGAEVADKQANCYNIIYTNGVLTIRTRPSGGGGGTYVPPANTETITNPDGSTTTITTKPDGTTITTDTNKAGDKTVTEVKADGSSVTNTKLVDGTVAVTTTDPYGNTEAKVELSRTAVDTAKKNETPVMLPIPPVRTVGHSQLAPAIKVTTGSTEKVNIKVPAVRATSGTVAVIVHPDGTEEVVRKSVAHHDGVTLPVENGATVKIVNHTRFFSDSSGHWAEEAISFVTSHELYNGTSVSTFSPNEEMTRGMLTVVLHNLESNPMSYSPDMFEDVKDSLWYADSIRWATEKGLISGYGNGTFGPNDYVSREQLAVILWHYAGSPKAYASLNFVDSDQVAGYSQEAMKWAVESGIINGTSNGMLAPQGIATRAQVAAMLMNFLESSR